jgi:hypothetical protein
MRTQGWRSPLIPRHRLLSTTASNLRTFYCTFAALICKLLISNGAGEGNRTLVTAVAFYSGHTLILSSGVKP